MSSKRTSQKTPDIEPQEPFAVAAQRLGDALADVITRPNCPADVADAVGELVTRVFNHHPNVEISLRHGFAYRLVGMLERPA